MLPPEDPQPQQPVWMIVDIQLGFIVIFFPSPVSAWDQEGTLQCPLS